MRFDELTTTEKIAACTRIIDMVTGALQALFAVRGVKYETKDMEILRTFVHDYPDAQLSIDNLMPLGDATAMHDAVEREANGSHRGMTELEMLSLLRDYREAARRVLDKESHEDE